MNSIYIESEKIQERKDIVEWLDGCGVKTGSGRNLSQMLEEMTNLKYYAVAFILPHKEFMRSPSAYYNAEGYAHCQTPEQFCQGVARIMGKPEPTFGEVNTTGQNLKQKLANKLEMHDNMESKTFPKSEPKGMAIDMNLLGEDERAILEDLTLDPQLTFKQALSSKYSPPYICMPKDSRILEFCGKDWYIANGYTITDSPKVFMEYVASQTGKEYKPEWGETHGTPRTGKDEDFFKKFDPDIKKIEQTLKISAQENEKLAEQYEKHFGISAFEPLPEKPRFKFTKEFLDWKDKQKLLDAKFTSYPHKTYRILDSLDGIPLDKRFKLSEWIPPYEAEVNFISNNDFDRGSFVKVDKHGIIVKYRNIETIFPVDGEWMRIV